MTQAVVFLAPMWINLDRASSALHKLDDWNQPIRTLDPGVPIWRRWLQNLTGLITEMRDPGLSIPVILSINPLNHKHQGATIAGKIETDYMKYSKSVMTGAKMGLAECERQFKYEPWNCHVSKDIKMMPIVNRARLPQANKETAFIHAITSAGVMYSVIVNCSLGHLENCRCQPKNRQKARSKKSDTADWHWGGCSDNVAFGDLVARHFVDALEGRRGELNEDRRMMNLHNNKVGRKMVKATTKKVCKCHGSSSSCTMKTCMKKIERFEKVGDALWEKYQTAVRVTFKNNTLVDEADDPVTKKKNKLVYFTPSPDYCNKNEKLKIPGVEGRVCEGSTHNGLKCRKLCRSCGLKMKFEASTRKVKCNCKFVWCCFVKCQECEKKVFTTTCSQ